jgi:tyrosine-protein kinase Etk/Wzc
MMSRKDLETVNMTGGLVSLTILRRSWQYRQWYLYSFIVCTASAFFFLRYAEPQYQAKALLLIRDDSRGTDFGDAALMEEFGFSRVKSNVDNEVEILKSRSLMQGVIEDLQLNVQYLATGRLKTTELYDKSPVRLVFLRASDIRKPETYQLNILDDKRYRLSTPNQHFTGNFQDTISLPQGTAILTRTRFRPSIADQYSIRLCTQEEAIRKHSHALTISATNKTASMVNLSLTDEVPARGQALLRRLISNYVRASIEEKNRVADSTISFIGRNLIEVSRELAFIEKAIEHFRRRNELVNMDEHSRLILQAKDQYADDENKLLVRLKVVELLEKDFQRIPIISSLRPYFSMIRILLRLHGGIMRCRFFAKRCYRRHPTCIRR